MSIHWTRALEDNFFYLIKSGDEGILVDPGEAGASIALLKKHQIKRCSILITHHHQDHVGGLQEVKEAFAATVYGPADDRISGIDKICREGDRLEIASTSIDVWEIPGHTDTHLAFILPKEKALFAGDVLLPYGCGRIFEGKPEQLHRSIQRISQLPGDTKTYTGHDYALGNLEFALFFDPDNLFIQEKIRLTKEGKIDTGISIADEKRGNPFFRLESIRKAFDGEALSQDELFTLLRKRKDSFARIAG